jgi:hypothetical protein
MNFGIVIEWQPCEDRRLRRRKRADRGVRMRHIAADWLISRGFTVHQFREEIIGSKSQIGSVN